MKTAFLTLITVATVAAAPSFAQTSPSSGAGNTGGAGTTGSAHSTHSTRPTRPAVPPLGPGRAGANALSDQDRDYLRKSSQGANSEVSIGRLAERKARNRDEKRFASRLVRDHAREKRELIRMDRRFGLPTPNTMLPEASEELRKLRGVHGADFDREFVTYEAKDHQEDIEDARKEAGSGQANAVQSLASRSLPVLKMHLRMAQSLANRLNGRTGSSH